jgi:hypothetical protein
MSGNYGSRFRVANLVVLLLALSLVFAGCGSIYPDCPEQRRSLVWEMAIEGRSAQLYPKDTGAADIAPLGEFGALPVGYFDPLGQKAGELNRSLIPKHNSQRTLELDHTTQFGWVAVDYNLTYDRQFTDTGSRGTAVYLDSVIEMVDRNGKIIWEAPGLAEACVFHVDDSAIGCYGKDPSLLLGIPGDVLTTEYASEVVRRYEVAPNRVLILDTATGSVEAEFDLPGTSYFTPIAVVNDGGIHDGNMVLSAESQDAGQPITGFLLSSASDGHTIRSVDLRKALPNTTVGSLEYTPAGLFALGEDSTVSRLDLDGKVLWTRTPRGGSGSGPLHVGQTASVVWASVEGLVMIEREEGGSYSTGPNSAAPFAAVTVFDANGNVLFEQGSLKRPIRSATAAPTVLARGESPRTGEDFLYVFDMSGGKIAVSKSKIPIAVNYAVSPSGEFVLILWNASEGQLMVSMYRLEGLD